MKRLLLTFLACGTSLTLAQHAQAQTDTPTPTPPAASPSASPGEDGGFHKHGHGGPGHEGPGGGGIVEHLARNLNLTDDQKQKVADIVKSSEPQFKALHEEMQAKRKALIESVASQISPILTADQLPKFTEMKERMENGPAEGGPGGPRKFGRGPGGQGGPGGPGHGGPGRGEMLQKMATDLGLTQDQQNQIKPILEATRTQMESIRSNTALTPDQKREQIKDAWQGAEGQINGLLTADQQQKLAAWRASHPHHFGPKGEASASPSASPAQP